ncbi:MAG: hypothetical protein JRD69_07900, partial [Deltaproteobacteria bacterium]|nr:hypothetical protein [Deltaproteobacteria bacterium]
MILADDYRAEGKEADRAETLKNIDIATGDAVPIENAFHQFLNIQKLWEKMMEFSSREEIKKRLTQAVTLIK